MPDTTFTFCTLHWNRLTNIEILKIKIRKEIEHNTPETIQDVGDNFFCKVFTIVKKQTAFSLNIWTEPNTL